MLRLILISSKSKSKPSHSTQHKFPSYHSHISSNPIIPHGFSSKHSNPTNLTKPTNGYSRFHKISSGYSLFSPNCGNIDHKRNGSFRFHKISSGFSLYPQNYGNISHKRNGYSRFHNISSGYSLLTQKCGNINHKRYGYSRFYKISSGYSLFSQNGGNINHGRNGVVRVRGFSSESDRESMEYDVVIVGAGPAGLSAAIRLKQLCSEKGVDLSVCVVEKGAEVGAHILSGNVFEPRALDELFPQWKENEAPIDVPVTSDKFWLLSKNKAFSLPSPFDNKGNYVISLSQLVRWLGQKAEELGVEIYPGFAAGEILYDSSHKVIGIATNDMGIAKDGSKKDTFQRGVELRGRVNLLAEGCRGSLSEKIIGKYNLREKGQGQHQTYALGIKEVWEVDAEKHKPGSVIHTLGWPLDHHTYGGSFLYHMKDRQVSIGIVVALNYQNPFLNPYEEFQKLKNHPAIRPLLEGGTVLQYGARTLNEGGFQFFLEEQLLDAQLDS